MKQMTKGKEMQKQRAAVPHMMYRLEAPAADARAASMVTPLAGNRDDDR
jgi:hypothetical protein